MIEPIKSLVTGDAAVGKSAWAFEQMEGILKCGAMSDSRPSLWDFNPLIRLDRSKPYFFSPARDSFRERPGPKLAFFCGRPWF
jgi:hypothetical protein